MPFKNCSCHLFVFFPLNLNFIGGCGKVSSLLTFIKFTTLLKFAITNLRQFFMSDAAAIKKSLSAQFAMAPPPPIGQIDPEALGHALQLSTPVTVIDVRQADEFATGHIAQSINIPLHELNVERLARAFARKRVETPTRQLVFVSLQSPDIDCAAAQDFMRYWDEHMDKDGSNPSSHFVQLLLGGVFHWLQQFRLNEKLTHAYNAKHWDPVMSHHAADHQ